ncbi:MAG: hypothetical protein HC829_04170 [Bacteroidales bacterium]|nr:hypothetical protein [Bacteroidales bacterium]
MASLRFLLLDNNDLSRDLEQRIAAFVSHCNSARYHDSLDNLTRPMSTPGGPGQSSENANA